MHVGEVKPNEETPLDEDNNVVVDDIYWRILPLAKEAEGNVLVELQWGWTAGMSEEMLAKVAEDAPKGHASVTTTLDDAEELRDRLTEIIDQNKARHAQMRAEWNQQYEEKYGKLLREAFPLKEDGDAPQT